jgi:hypothetical protein
MTMTKIRVFAFLAAQIPLGAQCAMCRTAASAQGTHASHMINAAILILLLPALVLFCGVFLMAFRAPASPTREEDADHFPDER